MSLPNLLNVTLLFCSIMFVAGCTEETKYSRDMIVGDWQLVKGLKNKKETGLLEGTTFQFTSKGQMSTNLPIGVESPAAFEIKGNTILQLGRNTVSYEIQSLSDSNLVLLLKMRGVDFEMHLAKYETEVDSLQMPQ